MAGEAIGSTPRAPPGMRKTEYPTQRWRMDRGAGGAGVARKEAAGGAIFWHHGSDIVRRRRDGCGKARRAMRYELYYWPEIQGRGEFVRLALEEAGADYVDVARKGSGEDRMIALMSGARIEDAAVRAAVPAGRQALDRADREHPSLPRRARGTCAQERSRAAMGASTAAHHGGFRSPDPRHPSPARRSALLRGPEEGGEAPRREFPQEPRAEIPRLFRGRAQEERRPLFARAQADLRRSLAVPDRRRPALRLSQDDEAAGEENPARRRAARPRGKTPARRSLSGVGAAGSRSTRWGSSGTTRSWTASAARLEPRGVAPAAAGFQYRCQTA